MTVDNTTDNDDALTHEIARMEGEGGVMPVLVKADKETETPKPCTEDTPQSSVIVNYFDRSRINAAKDYLAAMMTTPLVHEALDRPYTNLERADICAAFCHTFLSRSGGPAIRKHNGEPYIEHPRRVKNMVMEATGDEMTGVVALLHDVLEDTFLTYNELKDFFGEEVATLVQWVTNARQTGIPRNVCKAIEVMKTTYMPVRAKNVRCADVLDNTTDLNVMKPKFAALYLGEKQDLFYALANSGPLYDLAANDSLLIKLRARLFSDNNV